MRFCFRLLTLIGGILKVSCGIGLGRLARITRFLEVFRGFSGILTVQVKDFHRFLEGFLYTDEAQNHFMINCVS